MAINAHPELPEFDYLRPATLGEASRFLFEHPGVSRPLLGGTDIFVRMRDGFWTDRYLVDVKQFDGDNEISFDPVSGLTLGAAVTMNRLIASPAVQQHYPLLAEACRSVASYQLRTRATVVGNICNASPAGDTLGACLVLQAELTVHGVGGFRTVPITSFFMGPGKTVLKLGDIVTRIHFPLPPLNNAGTYLKLGRNTLSDLSIVGVTALGFPDAQSDSGYHFKLALASVAPIPLLVPTVENYLMEASIQLPAFKQAGQLAGEACQPIDDVRGGARYRKDMVRKLTCRALEHVWDQLDPLRR